MFSIRGSVTNIWTDQWANHLIIRIIVSIILVSWVRYIHRFIQSSHLPYGVDILLTMQLPINLSGIGLLYPYCPRILIISLPFLSSRVSLFGWYTKVSPCDEIVTMEQVGEANWIQGCWQPKPIRITLYAPLVN